MNATPIDSPRASLSVNQSSQEMNCLHPINASPLAIHCGFAGILSVGPKTASSIIRVTLERGFWHGVEIALCQIRTNWGLAGYGVFGLRCRRQSAASNGAARNCSRLGFR